MKLKYGIRHVATKTAAIKQGVFPPRLSDWTEDIEEAQLFEYQREAELAADFIRTHAFNVEVFDVDNWEKERQEFLDKINKIPLYEALALDALFEIGKS